MPRQYYTDTLDILHFPPCYCCIHLFIHNLAVTLRDPTSAKRPLPTHRCRRVITGRRAKRRQRAGMTHAETKNERSLRSTSILTTRMRLSRQPQERRPGVGRPLLLIVLLLLSHRRLELLVAHLHQWGRWDIGTMALNAKTDGLTTAGTAMCALFATPRA